MFVGSVSDEGKVIVTLTPGHQVLVHSTTEILLGLGLADGGRTVVAA
jgi:hypothetical protein